MARGVARGMARGVATPGLLLVVVPMVLGGCSYHQEAGDTSRPIKDMDAARLAAKMAIAHQGLEMELKEAQEER